MTSDQQIFQSEVEETLKSLGITSFAFNVAKGVPSCDLEYPHLGQIWPLQIIFYGWNIDILPSVYWKTQLPVWGWPHISSEGDVCISDREGLEYEPKDIRGVLSWLLEETVTMLVTNSQQTPSVRMELFSDELEGYLKNDGAHQITLQAPLDESKKIFAEVSLAKTGVGGLVHPVVRNVNQGCTAYSRCQQQRLGFIDVSIEQIEGLSAQWSSTWWNQFVSRLTEGQIRIASLKNNRGLLLRVFNVYGYALVLLYWGTNPRGKHTTYIIQRQYHDYLIERTGGKVVSKHMVVVGCGAVGARVAEHLALSGVEELTLIDYDIFSSDNLGRHILGKLDVGKLKVQALAQLLKERMPGITINVCAVGIQHCLKKESIQFSDAIVLATGNSVLERSIIRTAFKNKWPALLVSASVEAGGLGGHAIAMQAGKKGCLDCLYIDPDTQQQQPYMRTSLMAPGQKVTRQLTGCGAFTPYSSLDATKTAILAVERVLVNIVSYSRWAGYAEHALSQGIIPSTTYEAIRQGNIATDLPPSAYIQRGCPCCGV